MDVSGSASVADVSRAIIGVVARVSVPNAGLERKRRQDIVLSIAEKCVIADILTGIDRCSLEEQRDGILGICFVNLIVGVTVLIRSEENTSELQSLMRTSYAVFCLKQQKQNTKTQQQEMQQTPIDKTSNTKTHNRTQNAK